MVLAFSSFLGGFLTVLAPCILPLLPVLLSVSILKKPSSTSVSSDHIGHNPYLVIVGLLTSVFVFSILLKATTLFLPVPQMVWSILSGLLVAVFGLLLLKPTWWDVLMVKLGGSQRSQATMQNVSTRNGLVADFLLGAALGPVFNSCSPSYALIVAVLIPASLVTGLLYLVSYVAGLGVALLLIVWFGRHFVSRVSFIANPHGWFRALLGILLILVGLAIMTGFDKQIETYALDRGWYDVIIQLEQNPIFK